MRKRPKTSSRTRFAKKAALHAEKLINLAKKTRKKINHVLFEEYMEKQNIVKNIFYMSIGEYKTKYGWGAPKFQTFIIISKYESKDDRIRCVENRSDDGANKYSIESYIIKDFKQKQEIENSINSLVNHGYLFEKGKRVNLGIDEMLYKLKMEKTDSPFQEFRSKLIPLAKIYSDSIRL